MTTWITLSVHQSGATANEAWGIQGLCTCWGVFFTGLDDSSGSDPEGIFRINRGRRTVQVKSVKYPGVVGRFCFLTVARTYPTVGKLTLDPECLTGFRTGAKIGRLLSSLRFTQQVPRNLTFTSRPRKFTSTVIARPCGSADLHSPAMELTVFIFERFLVPQ